MKWGAPPAALYHPDALGMVTVPERFMPCMPLPQSTVPANLEFVNFAQLGSIVNTPRMLAAMGLLEGSAARINADQLLPLVKEAGPHGVSLSHLTHLDDAALLTLGMLLEPALSAGNATASQSPGLPVQTNALVLLALPLPGKREAQAYVRQHLRRQSGAEKLNIWV